VLASDPNLLVQATRELLGTNATIAHVSSRGLLIVTATPDEQSKVAFLLKEINRPAPNVRIDVVVLDVSQADNTGVALDGGTKVSRSSRGSKSATKVKVQLNQQNTGADQHNSQSVLVQSGSEASIFIGEDVPYADWIVTYGRVSGYMTQDFETIRVGSSLSVQPTVVGAGPLINVTLTPEISAMAGGMFRRVKYTKLATTVTARDGESVTIGALAGDKEFSDRFMVGGARGREPHGIQVRLTARIQKSFVAGPKPSATGAAND
jgi:type II secretory pathway component GspD/PulD (secretin)